MPMRTPKTIRYKLLIAVAGLGIVIFMLAYAGFNGVYAYRDLAMMVSTRASELPVTTELIQAVDELRFAHRSNRDPDLFQSLIDPMGSVRGASQFRDNLQTVSESLSRYKAILDRGEKNDQLLADQTDERRVVAKISELLAQIRSHQDARDINLISDENDSQRTDLNELTALVHQLPTFLQRRLQSFREEVRTRYRTWIFLATTASVLSLVMLVGLCWYARRVVLLPFKKLLHGSRRVASGEFSYRIEMESNDELSELANAINTGTASFLRIQRDLNDEVRERSREVIRNEQLASVGFLAAGVAHEIDNPLASIAWSAEALETRLHRLLHAVDPAVLNPIDAGRSSTGAPTDSVNDPASEKNIETLRTYLQRIQTDAFRCKGITERLLDFSRLGQAERKQRVAMKPIVEDVIDMVKHLSQYRNHRIDSQQLMDVEGWASPQEMKQVVLNLLTNALDSLPGDNGGGKVMISLDSHDAFVRLKVIDNGCGMTDEVRQHLFEPFFTQRQDGRGTGLGLPITSRIIADHGGHIHCSSDGPGLGSSFEVQIPKQKPEFIHDQRLQAA
jgi:signal transduction histidine kinase